MALGDVSGMHLACFDDGDSSAYSALPAFSLTLGELILFLGLFVGLGSFAAGVCGVSLARGVMLRLSAMAFIQCVVRSEAGWVPSV